MQRQDVHDITRLLAQLADGDQGVLDQLLPRVYDELRRLAQHHLQYERRNHTINATALVHEAYLKLAGADADPAWKNRAHFIAVASRAMRQILVDYARGRNRIKRGGHLARVSLEYAIDEPLEGLEDVLQLDDALTRLEAMNPQHSRIIEYRYFGGLSIEETAAVLGVSDSTVKRGWRAARAWLYQTLAPPS